ncbi:MAG TPA: lauroyl acyltransferase [Rhodobacteraceae bacterium]|nr:lauroyl acyltransferase [Paracoccaceae bacterium]
MPLEPSQIGPARRAGYVLSNLAIRAAIGGFRLLPYERRIPAMGATASRLARLAGFDRRVRANLALACPELSQAEVARLCRLVPDNAGRYMMELFSGAEFEARARRAPLTGPGFAALEAAREANRPIIAVSGHFGNYDAIRVNLLARGCDFGALYRPMANPRFNADYVAAMQARGGKLFAQGKRRDKRAMAAMVRHLRGGGLLAVVADLHVNHGAPLRFFGQTAHTSLVMAELALKYDALMVPVYGVRQPDGLNFEVEVHAPIPPSDPETMMQQLNDDLEVMVRRHMEQWFWIHRRWKAWPPPGAGIDAEADAEA